MPVSANNFIELLENNLSTVAERTAYTFLTDGIFAHAQTLTYGELATRARAVAALIQQSTQPNDRVLLVYPPGLDFIIAFFGCLYAGVIAVPTYPPQAQELASKLQLIIDNAKPALCLSTANIIQKLKQLAHPTQSAPSLLDKLQQFLGQATHVAEHAHSEWQFAELAWLATDNLTPTLASHWQQPNLASAQLALLQYTSGSTGNPKGVMVSHGNLLHNLATIYQQCGLNDQCQTVSWLPPYHDMGLIGAILQSVYGRFPCHMMAPMAFLKRPARWLQAIAHYRANISVAPNFAYDLCVERISAEDKAALELSCWELALNGAEPVHAATLERFARAFAPSGFRRAAFYPCYGMAEATLFIAGPTKLAGPHSKIVNQHALANNIIETVAADHAAAQTLISSGQTAASYTLRIVDPHTHQDCAPLHIGEIWLTGPSVTQGYWQQTALTRTNFQAYTEHGDGPFFRTGDLGFIEQEQLFVTGRLKDLIIIRGRNYYPQDIEALVKAAHPALHSGTSVAFTLTQAATECLVIIAEIKANLAPALITELCAAIRTHIAAQFALRVHAIALIPLRTLKKTTSGKVRRRLMRDLYLDQQLKLLYCQHEPTAATAITPTEQTSITSALTAWLITWIAQKLKLLPAAIDIARSLASYGFDSVLLTQLHAELEQHLNCALAPELFTENLNLNQLSTRLITLQQQHNHVSQNAVTATTPYTDFARIDTMPGFIQLKARQAELKMQGAQALFFNVTENTARDTLQLAGKTYINYCGYNYLGLSGEPEINAAACAAIEQYGTSVSASRLLAGEKPLHQQLEHALAALIGTEACLVFSAGHATNVATITHLFGARDLILHDVLIHNSALQGAIFSGAQRLAFPHNDTAALEHLLTQHRAHYERVLIITEGVYSMDGDIPPIPEFVRLKKAFHAFLMIDEAHSIGTIGATGAGIREYFNLMATDVDIWMGTLSKAFASCGGYIAGSHALIDYLKYGAGGFVYSAGISPANTAAALAAIEFLKRAPARVQTLQARAALLLNRLQTAGVNTGLSAHTPIIPVIVGDTERAIRFSEALKIHGIYVLPIFYPAVEKNRARLRFFVNATHTVEQIHATADAVITALAELNNGT